MFNLEIIGEKGESICYWFISSHQDEGWVYFGTIIEGYNCTRCKGFRWSHLYEQFFVGAQIIKCMIICRRM
jgi:hypothetical protein